jgi:hypothetical protein
MQMKTKHPTTWRCSMTARSLQFRILCLVLAIAASALSVGPSITERVAAQGDQRTFPETGQTVSGAFLRYWDSHGGLSQQGLPISKQMQEKSDTDGKLYTVQYFERAVFEMHPENTAPNDVLLMLVGVFRYKQKYPAVGGAPGQQPNTAAGSVAFQQTGKRLGGPFLDYWRSHGGLAQQGYPISDEFQEKSDLNGQTYRVQYFERAVFEWHSENQPHYDVLLSQLGTFRYKESYVTEGPRRSLAGGLVYQVPGMDNVHVQQDITYKTTAAEQLKLDVYSPPDSSAGESRPVVLFGGAKYASQWTSWARLYAASGLVSITFDFRSPPLGNGTPADALSDITDLISFARDNSAKLGIDKDRIALMSVSATDRYGVSAALKGTPPYIKAVVAYYGLMDDPDKSVSPIDYLRNERGTIPPIFIAKAGRDSEEVNQSIDRFTGEAIARGVTLQIEVHGEGGDGFDLLRNDGKSKQIISRTVDFLKAQLAAK